VSRIRIKCKYRVKLKSGAQHLLVHLELCVLIVSMCVAACVRSAAVLLLPPQMMLPSPPVAAAAATHVTGDANALCDEYYCTTQSRYVKMW
jgi:hypothetical protein